MQGEFRSKHGMARGIMTHDPRGCTTEYQNIVHVQDIDAVCCYAYMERPGRLASCFVVLSPHRFTSNNPSLLFLLQ